MKSVHFRGLLRWALWAALGVVVLCAALLFIASRILDLRPVRAALERQLSEAIQAQTTWNALEIQLLPLPRGVVHGLRITAPGTVTGRVDLIELALRLRPLLRGRVEIDAITLERPTLDVHIPAPTAPASSPAAGPAPNPLAGYRETVEPVMSTMRQMAPDATLVLKQGRVELHAAGLPAIGATDIDARVQSDAAGISATGTAAGDHWDQVRFRARVEFADLSATATADAVGLKPQDVLDRLLRDFQPAIILPRVGVHAEARTDGRTSLDVAFNADVPMMGLRRGRRQLNVDAAHLEGTARASGQDLELSVAAAHLGELVPSVSASLLRRGGQPLEASIAIAAVDLARLRSATLEIADDQAVVRDYVARIRGGSLVDGRFHARADTLGTLLSHVNGVVTLKDGAVLLPVVEEEATDIGAQLELVNGTLKARAATARLGASRLHDGTFDYPIGGGPMALQAAFDLDLAQSLDVARRALNPDQRAALKIIQSIGGRAQGSIRTGISGTSWDVKVDIEKSDSVVHVRDLPWPVSLSEGRVAATPGRIVLSGCSGSLGTSTISGMGADLRLEPPVRVESAAGRATLILDELYPWLRAQEGLAKALRSIQKVLGTAAVTVDKIHGRLDQPDTLAYQVNVAPAQVRVEMSDLPGPATVDGGSFRITPGVLTLDRVGAGLLDAAAHLSGTVSEYRAKNPRIDGGVSEGVAGPQLIDWIWRRADIPARLQPVAPLRFSASQMRWSNAGLDVSARVEPEAGGPSVGADLHLEGGALDIRRLALKDQQSDAVMTLAAHGPLLDASFSGMLAGRSVAALFKNALGEHLGRVEGDLRVSFDRDLRGYTSAQGRLAGEQVDLRSILSLPVNVNRIDIEADGVRVRIRELSLEWAGQKATIRGELERQPTQEVIRAEVDTPGVVINALLPPRTPTQGKAEAGKEEKARTDEEGKGKTDEQRVTEISKLWPLPVTGTVTLRAGYVAFDRWRVEPVHATLILAPRRAELQVAEAALCGIAFPFSASAGPGQLAFSVQLSARAQALEGTARCIDDRNLLLTGLFDLDAKLAATGKGDQILETLNGPVRLRTYDGVIKKFAVIGRILAYMSARRLFEKSGGEGEGLAYRDIRMEGHFGDGKFTLARGSLDSDALGIAATGTISLKDWQARLKALVAPFNGLDRLSRYLPIIGQVVGGLTSIPVRVSGDIRDPRVDPLDVAAVSQDLVGIFESTLKLPVKILHPFAAGESVK